MNTHSLRFRMTAWYAGLLAGSLILFGVSVYLGLERYLNWNLRNSLYEQGRSIGEKLLAQAGQKGEQYVIDETNEHYAPEISGRFIRLTRNDGSLLYQSSLPRDGSFDPTQVSVVNRPVTQEFSREEGATRGHPLLILSLPFTTPDGKWFLIETGASLGQIQGVLHGLFLTLALGMPLLVAGAIGGGYLLMRRALRPVDDITKQAERITSRNLSERLPAINSGDEIERLSASLNRMIGRLEDAFQHINRFTADVSHELRTPLTILKGELEAIAQRSLHPELLEMVGSALEETDRLTKIVDRLLAISRLDAGEARMERVRIDLGALATSTAEQMGLLADEKSIAVHYNIAKNVIVEGDASRLRQIVVNLLDNAIKYSPKGGSVQVSVGASGRAAVLEIQDNGPGISSEALPHIFERFYRADKARTRNSGGAGLGLSIVKAICVAHGGDIRVFSSEGEGCRFRVELPIAPGAYSDIDSPLEQAGAAVAREAGRQFQPDVAGQN